MSRRQVRTLLEGYLELQDVRDTWGPGLDVTIELADIQRGLHAMDSETRLVLFWCGVARTRSHAGADVLGVSRSTAYRLYMEALDELTAYLNQGGA